MEISLYKDCKLSSGEGCSGGWRSWHITCWAGVQNDDGKTTHSHLSYILIVAVQSKRTEKFVLFPQEGCCWNFCPIQCIQIQERCWWNWTRFGKGPQKITEGLKNMSLEKENKGSNLFRLLRCMLARELFAFKTWGREIWYSSHKNKYKRWKIELARHRVLFTCFPRYSKTYASFSSTPCFSSSSPTQTNLKYLYHVCPVSTSATGMRQWDSRNLRDMPSP